MLKRLLKIWDDQSEFREFRQIGLSYPANRICNFRLGKSCRLNLKSGVKRLEFFDLFDNYRYVIPDYQDVIPDYQDVIPDYQDVIPDYQDVIPDYQDVIPDYQDVIPDLIGDPERFGM